MRIRFQLQIRHQARGRSAPVSGKRRPLFLSGWFLKPRLRGPACSFPRRAPDLCLRWESAHQISPSGQTRQGWPAKLPETTSPPRSQDIARTLLDQEISTAVASNLSSIRQTDCRREQVRVSEETEESSCHRCYGNGIWRVARSDRTLHTGDEALGTRDCFVNSLPGCCWQGRVLSRRTICSATNNLGMRPGPSR